MKSNAILMGTMTILAIFVGTSVFSNSAYAAQIEVVCDTAPSEGTTLNYAVINNNNIDFTELVADDLSGNMREWNPNGVNRIFLVHAVPFATFSSVISVSLNDFTNFIICGVDRVIPVGFEANITKSMNTTASK